MYTVVILFHIVASVALILIVLLQTGRGAEMGAAFGGASQTLFGGSGGSTFLSKLTTGAAVVFMLTCLGLSYMSTTPQTRSIMKDVPVEQAPQAPAPPALPEARPVQPAPEQSSAVPQQTAPAQAAAPQVPEATAAPAAQQPAKEVQKPAPAAKQQQKPADKPAAGKKQ